MKPLLSSPDEEYIEHIKRAVQQLEVVFSMFEPALIRLLPEVEGIRDALDRMIVFHDLGKLPKRWQEGVGKGEKLPAHAPIGAAYLYKILPKGTAEPVSFAVAIHHTDRGLLGDNIERPDIQAINDGIINYSTNAVEWDERVDKLSNWYFTEEAKELKLNDIKEMARNLRVWARGCGLHEQHSRRLQVSLMHHVLKLCDISAAKEREDYRKVPENPYGGWLMTEKIEKYMGRIERRRRGNELKKELNRYTNSLITNYKPEKIILFGSFANNKNKIHKWSDIDLVIVKDTPLPFLDRIKEVLLILKPKVGIDLLIYTPEEFRKLSLERNFFKSEIISKGKVIYERKI